MFPFSDVRLNAIFQTGRCEGIPDEVAQRVYLLLHIFVHTRRFSAIGAFAHVRKLGPNKFAVDVDRWTLTFSWDWDHNYVAEPALQDA